MINVCIIKGLIIGMAIMGFISFFAIRNLKSRLKEQGKV